MYIYICLYICIYIPINKTKTNKYLLTNWIPFEVS